MPYFCQRKVILPKENIPAGILPGRSSKRASTVTWLGDELFWYDFAIIL